MYDGGTIKFEYEGKALVYGKYEGGEVSIEERINWYHDDVASNGVVFVGSAVGDFVEGTDVASLLLGNEGADTISGGNANDELYGGAKSGEDDGASDNLAGGEGDDIYYVYSSDLIVELADGGIDHVFASGTYSLGDNLEDLTLDGSNAIDGTGNDDDNIITGNGASNNLTGADGKDLVLGGIGIDTLHGGSGEDILIGGIGTDKLYGDDDTEVDILTGGGGADDFYVGAGDIVTDFDIGDRLYVNGLLLTVGEDFTPWLDDTWSEVDIELPYAAEGGLAIGLIDGGFAVMSEGMSAPALVFGPNAQFSEDPESERVIRGLVDRPPSEPHDDTVERHQFVNSDRTLTLTEWREFDDAEQWSGQFVGVPGYASAAYSAQDALASGLIDFVTSAQSLLNKYGYIASSQSWNEYFLRSLWHAGDDANTDDQGSLQTPDGRNSAGDHASLDSPGQSAQAAAAAISNAETLLSPLVLDLDGDGVELNSLAKSKAYFDLDGNFFAQRTGWVTGGDGLLAIDANENGQIDDINELFGAPEPYGKATTNGFDALAALDSNSDDKIDSSDTKFGDLKVWIDADADGITDSGELKTLSEVGVASISLTATENVSQNEGNTVSHTAEFTKAGGGAGTVADVWFANSSLETYDNRTATVDSTVMALPALRGYGEVAGLRLTMSRDPFLFQEVQELAFWGGAHGEPIPSDLLARIESIALGWMIGDAEIVDRGENIAAAHLMALERFTGQSFFQSTGPEGPNPGPNAAAALDAAWGDLVLAIGARILVQSLLKPAFDGVTYDWGTDSFDGTLDAADAVAALAALAPSGGGSDAHAFWKLAVATLDAVADDLNIAQGGYDTDLADALSNAGFELTLAQLRDANVHQVGGEGTVVVAEQDAIIFGASGANDVHAGSGNDTINGGAGNDRLDGQAGSDTYVFGKDGGHDVISDVDSDPLATDTFQLSAGIAPADVLIAREGDDLVIRIAGTDSKTVIEGQFLDSDHGIEQIKFANGAVWNRAFIEALPILGTGGDDTLAGTGNNDFIDGGVGADGMTGGKGSDTYVVNDKGDVVTEAADEGTDLVQSDISYVLGANVEQLILTTGNIDGTGNELDNILIGTEGTNVLDGGEGADLLIGVGEYEEDTFVVDNVKDKVVGWGLVQSSVSWSFADNGGGGTLVLTGTDDIDGSGSSDDEYDGITSDDELIGNVGKNQLSGNGGMDTLDGGEGDDTLDGGDGDDTITGGLGADAMTGGAGNDVYWVDDLNDTLTEGVKKGVDIVNSSVDFVLAANVENLALTDEAAIVGTGNALRNVIVGSDADNVLDGAEGNDEIRGGLGSDTLLGGAGNDYMRGEAGADVMQGGDGNDSLNGGDQGDILTGGDGGDILEGVDGDDQLDGGAGADSLYGGTGNDTYLVNDSDDVVSENSGGLADLVLSTISYTLTANVERLTLGGASDIDGTGNSLANLITGNDGANVVDGRSGNDTVDGGAGNDSVVGGDGNDTVSGQAGIDTLQGGNGNDILVWDADDSLDGGANRDTLLHAATGAIDVDTAKLSNIEVVNLGAGDDNDNGIILNVQDVLDLAASSSGSGFSKNGDVIDLLIYGDNATATRDNVELGGTWTAAGTFSTSALTGSTITFNIYQASGTQVAVQQGMDLTIV